MKIVLIFQLFPHKNTEICVKLCKDTEIVAICYWSEFPRGWQPCNLKLKWQVLTKCCPSSANVGEHMNGLVHEKHNSSVLAIELHLSCTNPSISYELWISMCHLTIMLWLYNLWIFIISTHWEVNIGWSNGLVPSSNMPLPAPMLTQIYVAIWRH